MHDRVWKAAIQVYELHKLQEEHKRIVAEERMEEERLKAEAAAIAEEEDYRNSRHDGSKVPSLHSLYFGCCRLDCGLRNGRGSWDCRLCCSPVGSKVFICIHCRVEETELVAEAQK